MHNANKQRSRQRGFTLIEIMVVVVILGILATIVAPKLLSRPDEARVQKAKQDIKALEGALSLYKLDNFNFPDTGQGLQALVGKYVEKLPTDPWGNEYQYLIPGTESNYDLYSFGADGTPGGEDVNADITR